MQYQNLSEEKKLWKRGKRWVVGLDEAGRGPLAGPVIAAAVVINSQRSDPRVGDKQFYQSKKYS